MRNKLLSDRHIGDFEEGLFFHHGAVQITSLRNRQYINKFGDGMIAANPEVSRALGFEDPDGIVKRERFDIADPGLVSQGFVFNTGFGLSVHDISFNAVANLSYSGLVFGVPVFEGDTVFCGSTVLGVEFRKDGATSGSVQVETTVSNQRGETVLSYVRQVLVRAARGKAHKKFSSVKKQPAKVDISQQMLPPRVAAGGLRRQWLCGGKTFESLKTGEVLTGSVESGMTLADFSWLQISTLNDAAVHHRPSSVFIGYGGAVKAFCEGAVSSNFPLAVHLAMNSGAHNAPTYPSDIVGLLYGCGTEEENETLRAKVEIVEKTPIAGRDDFGVVTVCLTGEKRVTDAGMMALNKAGFSGADAIFEDGGEKWIRVLTLEQVIAVPTERCFSDV